MPISGNSYYDDNQANGEKKKPFFKAYLDALKAGKQALDDGDRASAAPPVAAPAPIAAAMEAPASVTPPVSLTPNGSTAPSVTAGPIAPTAIQNRPARRPAKRRRSGPDSGDGVTTPKASMDAMMQHILELAQKVEAAASKVEAVADKAEASARPTADDGVMVPARTNFSLPAPQFGAHTGAADSTVPAVPVVDSDFGSQSSSVGLSARRGADADAVDRDVAASGLVTLGNEMSIPKVAPFILDKAVEAPVSPPPLPELRAVDGGVKAQAEPRPQGAPILLRSQKKHDPRAVNESR